MAETVVVMIYFSIIAFVPCSIASFGLNLHKNGVYVNLLPVIITKLPLYIRPLIALWAIHITLGGF